MHFYEYVFFYAKILFFFFCENVSFLVKIRFLQSLKIKFVNKKKTNFYRKVILSVRK